MQMSNAVRAVLSSPLPLQVLCIQGFLAALKERHHASLKMTKISIAVLPWK
jgi:hypothetical protein